jgi:uncharacterized protein (TIGR02996 family)
MSKILASDEDKAFIRKILTSPGDVAPRLVYADWLDEHDTDDSHRAAEFLRLLAELTQTGKLTRRYEQIKIQLRRLQEHLPKPWVAYLDVPLIEACAEQFRFVCPKSWERLRPDKNALVRHCEHCERDVHYCATIKEAAKCATEGKCVAIPSSVLRHKRDLEFAIDKLHKPEEDDLFGDNRIVMGDFA